MRPRHWLRRAPITNSLRALIDARRVPPDPAQIRQEVFPATQSAQRAAASAPRPWSIAAKPSECLAIESFPTPSTLLWIGGYLSAFTSSTVFSGSGR